MLLMETPSIQIWDINADLSFQANGDAAVGKYGGGVAGAAADEGLFIKDHAY